MAEKKSRSNCALIAVIVVLLLCCCSSSFLLGGYYLIKNAYVDLDTSGFDEYLPDDLSEDPFFEDYNSSTDSSVTLADVRETFLATSGYRFSGVIHYPSEDVRVSGTYLSDGSETYYTYDEMYGDVSEVTIADVYYINYGDGWEITEDPYNAGIQRTQITYLLENGGDDQLGDLVDGQLRYSYFDDDYNEDFVLYVDPDTKLPQKLEYDYYSSDYEDYISEEMEYSDFNDDGLEVLTPQIP